MAETDEMKQSPQLRGLAPGERFCGYYLLKSAQSATTGSGKPYLSLRLADRTGELPGKFWDYAGPIGAGDAGQAVWASGRVELFQNAPQLSLDHLRLTDGEDDFDPACLVPSAPYDPQQMLSYVESTLQKLADADYRGVCLKVLERRREAFALLPGGKAMHHAFLHGLLMHTANMMRQADYFARLYPDVIDRSLLIAGAFLHDIGKLEEYATSALGLISDYTKDGQLLGHLFLGAEEVGAAARELGIPEEKRMLLQHLIVSHHGKTEFGAVVLPKCAEAELLANIDMIDSRMEIYRATYADTPAGEFSRQRVYGLNNNHVYHPAADEET
jgi:3'-5' exoribonuclease